MKFVSVRDLRNHTTRVLERVRLGEEVAITSSNIPVAMLLPIGAAKRPYLTTADLERLGPRPGEPVPEYYDDEEPDETTDDLGPIQ